MVEARKRSKENRWTTEEFWHFLAFGREAGAPSQYLTLCWQISEVISARPRLWPSSRRVFVVLPGITGSKFCKFRSFDYVNLLLVGFAVILGHLPLLLPLPVLRS